MAQQGWSVVCNWPSPVLSPDSGGSSAFAGSIGCVFAAVTVFPTLPCVIEPLSCYSSALSLHWLLLCMRALLFDLASDDVTCLNFNAYRELSELPATELWAIVGHCRLALPLLWYLPKRCSLWSQRRTGQMKLCSIVFLVVGLELCTDFRMSLLMEGQKTTFLAVRLYASIPWWIEWVLTVNSAGIALGMITRGFVNRMSLWMISSFLKLQCSLMCIGTFYLCSGQPITMAVLRACMTGSGTVAFCSCSLLIFIILRGLVDSNCSVRTSVFQQGSEQVVN